MSPHGVALGAAWGVALFLLGGCAPAQVEAHSADEEAPAITPVVVDALPLRPGFYVRTDDQCAKPSQATLALMGRTGVSGCDFTRIERFDGASYNVGLSCPVRGAPPGHEHERDDFTNQYEILAEDRYRVTFESGESAEFAFCPQHSMPEPWRSNDISDLIN